jgi:hypothetical protein
MRWRHTIGWTGAIVFSAGFAGGAPPEVLRIVGDEGGCPAPPEVAASLGRMLSQSKLVTASSAGAAEDVVLADGGNTFRVVVAGQSRVFEDPARDCPERARNVAVFVALVLDPPVLPEARPPPPPPDATPLPPPPVPDRAAPKRELDLDLGAVVQMAPAASTTNTPVAAGLASRLRWGRRPYLSFGVAAFLPLSLHFAHADARATWFPLDAAAGLFLRRGPWDVSAEVGPTATLLSIRGENLQNAQRQTRLELGARGAATARFWLGQKNALFLSAQTSFFPKPYALAVRPDEALGTTPGLWLGASIGASLQIE